jgi:hypothetical protein
MTARTHPFQRKVSIAVYQEKGVFWALRAFTYIILAFGIIIFSVIIYKGSPAVFGSMRLNATPPFIHNDFLFTKPQTLLLFLRRPDSGSSHASRRYRFLHDNFRSRRPPSFLHRHQSRRHHRR